MALQIKDRVKETTTTTGTGALTLAGAMTGFRSFSSVCSVGDVVYYALQAVDGSGNPTMNWECGLGTYSAAATLTRTTILSSSNAGAVVSLAAGTTQVWIDFVAASVYAGGLANLSDTDVTNSAATDGQSLVWSNAAQRWVAEAIYLGPPATITTWDPTRMANYTLSVGNTVASYNSGGAGSYFGVLGTVDVAKQKTYWEVGVTASGSLGVSSVGLVPQTSATNISIGQTTGNGAAVTSGGSVVNGSSTPVLGLGSLTAPYTIGIAYNPTTRQMWFRANGGLWNAGSLDTQNPATGAGGIILPGTYDPYPACSTEAAGLVFTVNHGNGTAFGTAAPAGYAGFTPGGAGVADVTVSGPVDGQLLQYSASAGKWVNAGGGAPYFRAYASASQTITSGTSLKVAHNTIIEDSSGGVCYSTANAKWTPNKAGLYRIKHDVAATYTNASIQPVYAKIYKNGAQVKSLFLWGGALGGIAMASADLLIRMNGATDYVEGWVLLNGGTSDDTAVTGAPIGETNCTFEGHYIGP